MYLNGSETDFGFAQIEFLSKNFVTIALAKVLNWKIENSIRKSQRYSKKRHESRFNVKRLKINPTQSDSIRGVNPI